MATPGSIRAGRAFVEVGLDKTKFVKGLRMAEAQLRSFGQKIQNIGMKFMAAGGVLSLPFSVSTKIFVDFDDQMKTVQAVTMATGDEFDKLTEKAKKLGRTTSFTASQVASGMVVLGRQGFSGDEIEKSISGVLALARSTDTDLAEAATYASDTLRAFGMEARQMNRVVDVMTATANNSAQSLEDLGQSMKYAAPIASKYGSSLEETSNALGILANVGIKGSLAGTGLRTSMTRLSDPKIRKRLRQLGISVGDASGNMREFLRVMKEIGKVTQAMGSVDRLAILGEVFGRRAMSAGASLTTESFERLEKAIANASGIAEKTMAVMESGLGGSFRRLRSAIEGIAIAVGKSLEKPLMVASKIIKDISLRVIKFVNVNKKLVAQIAAIGVGLLVVGGALIGLGVSIKLMAFAISTVIAPLGIFKVAVLAVKVALTIMAGAFALVATKGGLIVAALAAVSVAIIATNQKAKKGVAGVVASFTAGAGKIKGVWLELVYLIKQGNTAQAMELMWAGIKSAWSGGVAALTEMWFSFKSAVISATNSIAVALVGAFFKAQEAIKKFFVDMKRKDSIANLLKMAPLAFSIESTEQTINDAESRIAQWKKEGYEDPSYQKWVDGMKSNLVDMKDQMANQWIQKDEETKKADKELADLQRRNNEILAAIKTELKDGLSFSDQEKLTASQLRASKDEDNYQGLLAAAKGDRKQQQRKDEERALAEKKGGNYFKRYQFEEGRRNRLDQLVAAEKKITAARQAEQQARQELRGSRQPDQKNQMREKVMSARQNAVIAKAEYDKLRQRGLPRRTSSRRPDGKRIQKDFQTFLAERFGGGGMRPLLAGIDDKMSAAGSFSGFSRFGSSGELASADRTATATETIANNTKGLLDIAKRQDAEMEV